MINHNFKKKFGQNFISDINLLTAIVNDAEITSIDNVLEIGAGEGSLTKILDKNAKKVISYEIDKDLEVALKGLNLKNTTFIFKDVLEEPIEEIENNFSGNYKIVANLPYYITTPLIFKFLNNSDKVISLTIMVQKEVAERMIAKSGEKNFGILSIMTNFYGDVQITRFVNRKMFYPVPNVDSAIVKIDIKKKYNVNKEKFYRFIQSCFSMRRKTLRNNLFKSYPLIKDELLQVFKNDLNKRGEELTLNDFIKYYKKIENLI